MDTALKKIIENILAQAKYFLNNTGEFYPFGSILTYEGEIRPVGAYTGEEFPNSQELLNFLENAIKDGIKNHHYMRGGIAIDVFLTPHGKERVNGIEIRLYEKDLFEKRYYTYEKKAENYFIYEFSE